MGCEAEGADVGVYCSHNPTTPTIHVKLLRTVTPWESQPSTGAAADPLGRRGTHLRRSALAWSGAASARKP